MKKEKQVRSYKRRTKSGKTVTVKAHTAKYEAADEKAKEVSKKPGAGKELEERKKKPMQLEIPFDKEEEKKVLDEVKGEEKKSTSKKSEKPAEKKTTKKVRPVGSGTNGPAPKSSTSSTTKSATSSVKRDPTDVEFLARQIAQSRSGSIDAARNKVNNMSDRTYRSWLRSYGVLNDEKGKSKSTKTAGTKSSVTSKPAFTAAEFKEWYRGTGSAADKKVAKALRAQLGRSGYRKFEDEAIDNYTSRGHLSMFKRVSSGSSISAKPKSSLGTKKETSSDLRARADKMDADTKRSAIVKKLGSNKFRTIKDININVVKPNTRSAQLKGTLYVSSDRTKAYYEGSDGKLKKATKSILDRYVNKESKKRSVGTGTNEPESKVKKGFTTIAAHKDAIEKNKNRYNTFKDSGWKTKRKNGKYYLISPDGSKMVDVVMHEKVGLGRKIVRTGQVLGRPRKNTL